MEMQFDWYEFNTKTGHLGAGAIDTRTLRLKFEFVRKYETDLTKITFTAIMEVASEPNNFEILHIPVQDNYRQQIMNTILVTVANLVTILIK